MTTDDFKAPVAQIFRRGLAVHGRGGVANTLDATHTPFSKAAFELRRLLALRPTRYALVREYDPKSGPRIFQVGFMHCGTTSLGEFLNRSGIPCIHHDRGRLARRMRDNLRAGRRPLDGYEQWTAFTNMDLREQDDGFQGGLHHRELLATYGGLFILNTRPVEHWLRSMTADLHSRVVRDHYGWRFGSADPTRVAERLRAEWDQHHSAVVADVPADQLLVFDIESDPPERLCDFVGLPQRCARHWAHQNPRMGLAGRVTTAAIMMALPAPLLRAAPNPLKLRVKRLLRTRRRRE